MRGASFVILIDYWFKHWRLLTDLLLTALTSLLPSASSPGDSTNLLTTGPCQFLKTQSRSTYSFIWQWGSVCHSGSGGLPVFPPRPPELIALLASLLGHTSTPAEPCQLRQARSHTEVNEKAIPSTWTVSLQRVTFLIHVYPFFSLLKCHLLDE